MNPHKEFCLYFNELDALGISWGISDLFKKANELEIKPCDETLGSLKNKCQ